MPAYDACCELLPPLYDGDDGRICISPLCGDEYDAQMVYMKLNVAWKRYCRDNNQQ